MAVATVGFMWLFVTVPAWSWGVQGHHTTGAIADRLLNAKAKAAVAELLADDLTATGEPSGRTTLEAVSVWADEIRGTDASHPTWHYENRPACGISDESKYCANGDCNTAQIPRLLAVVTNTQAPHRARNEALKWVVHLVGDIHQPLHATDNADRGGNSVVVSLPGFPPKERGRELHGAWDTDFVMLALASPGGGVPPEIDALARQASRIGRRTGQGDPPAWARESNQLARAVVYKYPAFACLVTPTKAVTLDEDYQVRAARVVRERLLLGGARLAELLNTALGS
jgi:hypothetical protein